MDLGLGVIKAAEAKPSQGQPGVRLEKEVSDKLGSLPWLTVSSQKEAKKGAQKAFHVRSDFHNLIAITVQDGEAVAGGRFEPKTRPFVVQFPFVPGSIAHKVQVEGRPYVSFGRPMFLWDHLINEPIKNASQRSLQKCLERLISEIQYIGKMHMEIVDIFSTVEAVDDKMTRTVGESISGGFYTWGIWKEDASHKAAQTLISMISCYFYGREYGLFLRGKYNAWW